MAGPEVVVVGQPLDVVIYSPGLPHDGTVLQRKSLGGSETATVHLARALAAAGHHVTVFAPNPEPPGPQGDPPVVWLSIELFPQYVCAMPHDVTVVCRDMNQLRLRFNSKVAAFWCHDLGMRRNRNLLSGTLWNLDQIVVQSVYQRDQYQRVYGPFPEGQFLVARNGIDVAALTAVRQSTQRVPGKLVYGSRPERGLDQALSIMQRLGAQGSDAVLHVATYDNTPAELAPYYEQLYARAKTLPNVRLLGHLKQAEWHRELASAQALLYPGTPGEFREISCIVAMEAMGCGTPVVAAAKGALPETLGGDQAGVLLGTDDTDANDPAYLDEFADVVQALLTDQVRWQRLSRGGMRRAEGLSWAGVASLVTERWCALLADRCSNPVRVRRWCERIGERDVLAVLP